MIPGGGDQSFYDSFKKNEAKEFNPETNSGRELLRKLKGGATKQVQRAPGSGEKKVYSYPEKQGPSQITGDRFLIKCIEFEPPDDGTGLGLELNNAFYRNEKGKLSVITAKQRQDNNIKPIEFNLNKSDASMRMGADQRRLMKYMIEIELEKKS